MTLVPLNEIFEVNYGNKFDLNKMVVQEKGEVAFIGRTAKNNGITAYVKRIKKADPYPAGFITVNLGGAILESYLQPSPFYTAQNIAVLKPLLEMSDKEKLYYCLAIKANKFRYGAFGREANRTLRTLLVPASVPSKLMNLKIEGVSAKALTEKEISLKDRSWKWFQYDDVFTLTKGHYNNRPVLDENGVPFISATENNNGITDFVVREGTTIFPAKSITVSNDGSVGNAFYQDSEFTCSHSVNVIRINPKYGVELNQFIAIFLISLIQKEKYRFGYGFKWRIERMRQSKVKLPVDISGNPDWAFMENYVKTLPYSASI